MHEVVSYGVLVWLVVLVGALVVHALRVADSLARALALDMLALVFVAALAVVAVQRGTADYLDVALVLGLLGFAQTLATARYVEAGEAES